MDDVYNVGDKVYVESKLVEEIYGEKCVKCICIAKSEDEDNCRLKEDI